MEKDNREDFEAEKFRIVKMLTASGLDISSWGQGEAKTIDHLAKELLEGESALVKDKSGELVRVVRAVSGIITFTDLSGRHFQLFEDRQVFSDGRTRRREYMRQWSVSEKIGSGEEPREALVRGIGEELGVKEGYSISENPEIIEQERVSNSFPGLASKYQKYIYDVTFDSMSFNPEGYQEQQSDKTTYFVWEEVNY